MARIERQLTIGFVEVADEQHAFALLQRIGQGKDESLPLYAERVATSRE